MNDERLMSPAPRALPLPDGIAALDGSQVGRSAIAERTPVYAWPAPEETPLWRWVRVVVRRRWMIATFFLLTLISTAAATLSMRPVFSATATLKIEKEEPRVVKFDDVIRADTRDDYYQTQYDMLAGRTLAETVIAELALDKHPEFDPTWYDELRDQVRRLRGRWSPLPPKSEPTSGLRAASTRTDAFLKRLTIDPIRSSRLVKISFDSYYPDLAAQVPNAVVETFIRRQLDAKGETTRYAVQFLDGQLREAGKNLRESEVRLNEFLKSKDILFLVGDQGDQLGERQDLVSRQLSLLSDALLKARAERIAKESLFAQTVRRDTETLPAVLLSPLIGRRKEELANLEAEYRKLGVDFRPEYPRMKQLELAIVEIRGQLRQETTRVVESLDAEYHAALDAELELQKAVDGQLQLARRLGDEMPQYRVLRRDLDTSRQLYSALLTRLKETQISSALITSNISVVDPAEIPAHPVRPRTLLNLLLGMMVGVVGGVALGFVAEQLDPRIRDEREIPRLLRVPTLGRVPPWAPLNGRRLFRALPPADRSDADSFALVSHTQLASVFSDAFRSLRTSVLYCGTGNPPKTLMVTSLAAEDGKTSIAANLAITLAELGQGDVLLIDADLRHPDLHDVFAIPPVPGLAGFLESAADVPVIVRSRHVPRLHVLPAGRASRNPADLLGSSRLSEMLGALRGRFAHIVFDTSPLFGVPDTLAVAACVDGVAVVLRQGRARREDAQRAFRLLESARAPILGVILNRDRSRDAAYYGYSAEV